MDIARARLSNQLLSDTKKDTPGEVVAWLGAVQAQDFAAAKWALGQRLRCATDGGVEEAFNEGAILRTHVMRPTWHFLTPQDLRSVQALSAPRAQAGMASGYRKLELDGKLLSRCQRVLVDALSGDKYLTRSELSARLAEKSIQASGQRLSYILMHAEFEALICSGPRRGRQFTYALVEERVPKAAVLPAMEALAQWTLRYFRSHGPAQAKDFAWWSGLTLQEARRGLEMVAGQLRRESVNGNTYWFSPRTVADRAGRTEALLLSLYDEYTIAYRDRSVQDAERRVERLISMGNTVNSVLILDGRIAGTWKRAIGKERVEILVRPFRKLRKAEAEAIEQAASGYSAFLQLPVNLWLAQG